MSIAVIVMWENKGSRKICGQTLGADGAGTFAKVFVGEDLIKADRLARKFVEHLLTHQEYRGHIKIKGVVSADEGFYGSPIQIENVD